MARTIPKNSRMILKKALIPFAIDDVETVDRPRSFLPSSASFSNDPSKEPNAENVPRVLYREQMQKPMIVLV